MITQDTINGAVRVVRAECGEYAVTIEQARWDANRTASGKEENDFHIILTRGGLHECVLGEDGMRALCEALGAFGYPKAAGAAT